MSDGFDAEHHEFRRVCLLFPNGRSISVSLFWWHNPEFRFEQHMYEKSIRCSSGIKWAVPYRLGSEERKNVVIAGCTDIQTCISMSVRLYRHGKSEVVNEEHDHDWLQGADKAREK